MFLIKWWRSTAKVADPLLMYYSLHRWKQVKSVFLWQAWKGLEMPWLLTTSGAVGQWWSEPCAVCLENYTDFCMVATGTLTGIQVQGWNPQIHSKTLCWFSGTWVSLGVEKYPTSCEQSVWQFLHDKIWDLCDMYWCILHQLWSLLILDLEGIPQDTIHCLLRTILSGSQQCIQASGSIRITEKLYLTG